MGQFVSQGHLHIFKEGNLLLTAPIVQDLIDLISSHQDAHFTLEDHGVLLDLNKCFHSRHHVGVEV